MSKVKELKKKKKENKKNKIKEGTLEVYTILKCMYIYISINIKDEIKLSKCT